MSEPHVHEVIIYYEDTDFSGYVYHANYLKYFERAREHFFGVQALQDMYRDTGVGFVVYKAELTFKEPAVHADVLEIRTVVTSPSPYRASFDQQVFRKGEDKPLVKGMVELVCIDKAGKLVALPPHVRARILERAG